MPRGLRDLERAATFREQSGKGPVIVLWGLALPLYQPGETSYVPVTEKEALLTPVELEGSIRRLEDYTR